MPQVYRLMAVMIASLIQLPLANSKLCRLQALVHVAVRRMPMIDMGTRACMIFSRVKLGNQGRI